MKRLPIVYAILAAVCYGISAPVAKILLTNMTPTFMAAMLYLGAGLGMVAVNLFQKKRTAEREARITKKELPYTVAMVILDIAAPILLMLGLTMTTSATASLLNNFEIVATAIIALFAFKEAVGKRMWLAIAFITVSSIILSVEDFSNLTFSLGAVSVLLACVFWGVENNCTSRLSQKNPMQIVIIKGIGSGALLITVFTGVGTTNILYVAIALLLGFVAYGMSMNTCMEKKNMNTAIIKMTDITSIYTSCPLWGSIAMCTYTRRTHINMRIYPTCITHIHIKAENSNARRQRRVLLFVAALQTGAAISELYHKFSVPGFR